MHRGLMGACRQIGHMISKVCFLLQALGLIKGYIQTEYLLKFRKTYLENVFNVTFKLAMLILKFKRLKH